MAGLTLQRKTIQRLAGCLGGACLTILAGCAVFHFPFGQKLTDRSYDLPFLSRAPLAPPGIVLIYLDAPSRARFQLPSGLIDRRRQVELLRRLTRDQARMVFYDIVFRDSLPDVDPDFAAAIREHGQVVLGSYDSISSQSGADGARAYVQEAVRPNDTLRSAARHTGLLMVAYPDATLAVRELFTGDQAQEAAVWAAACEFVPERALGPRLERRWLNFYGPSPAFPSISFAAALDPDSVGGEFFRDKIVFIGHHPDDLVSLQGREKFATPWTQAGHALAPGVELLATSLGNLVQQNWLRRLSDPAQAGLIIGFGLFIGVTLALLRPWRAVAVAVLSALVVGAIGFGLHYRQELWWSWLIPVTIQVPLALVWSIGFQYVVASRREAGLQRAFSSYLSPHLVRQIAASDFDLAPGGREVEATVLFTDLDGFTTMAESLPPAEVSRILTGYFEQITRHILEHEGTIIKYVGDSVMAVWGAPLADARQAERAVLAARGIRQASPNAVAGRRLRTRIGINSGKALAGNLGSPFRFDYTVIGATTNLANRLESLNKRLRTDLLISEATRVQLPATQPTRYLGRFRLRGTTQPVAVHEVPEHRPVFAPLFDQAVRACESGDVAAARALFERISEDDGPTQFYLEQLKGRTEVRLPFVLEES